MKIVDSFLFSETYEKELLLLKFILEDKGVNEWIIIENAYSFQGEYKGLNARNLIDNDDRFKPFRSKITYIEKNEVTEVIPKHVMADEISYKVEYWQRDLVYDYFIENYDDEDWLMIADVDEMIDFTDEKRSNELNRQINNSNGLLVVPTKRYWYDFDNEYKLLINNVMCSKKYLIDTGKKIHELRRDFRRVSNVKWKHIVEFEYSSCYNIEHIQRKFYTSTHTGLTPNDLNQSLRCNHRPVYEVRRTKPENSALYFFETVRLNEANSPKYIRENLARLKTNNIDINYRQNRRIDYPELFTLSHHISRIVKEHRTVWQKKFRYAVRKLKMERFIYGSSAH